MTNNFDNELLSALLDGELSPDEADRVRAAVEQSAELKSELESLEALGSMLNDVRSMPAANAPTDLAQSVMSNLVPKSEPVTGTTEPPRRSRWKLWSGAGAMLAGAAAVMLMLRLGGPQEPNARVADQVAKNDRSVTLAEEAGAVPAAPNPSSIASPIMAPSEGLAFPVEAVSKVNDDTAVFRIETESRNPEVVMARFLKTLKLNATEHPDSEGTVLVVDLSEAQFNRVTNAKSLLDHGLSLQRESGSELRERLIAALGYEDSQAASSGMGAAQAAKAPALKTPSAPAKPLAARPTRVAKTESDKADNVAGSAESVASEKKPAESLAKSNPPMARQRAKLRPDSPIARKRRVIFFFEKAKVDAGNACEDPA